MQNEQTTPNRQLQCAACGFLGDEQDFYNSSVHAKFRICPECGTVRFACEANEDYRRPRHGNEKQTPVHIKIINRIPNYSASLKKLSKKKIQETMRSYEYDDDFIEAVDDRFCEGFTTARDIIIEMLEKQYWEQQKGEQ